MYLKNLTALGFKSFADKMTLSFMPGITAVVGPNGCGKSNIADAIRWVLGEQSAKALRGGEMSDVIFNGTDTRKALGLAEVSLTIGGVDQDHLKAAGVELEFDEVTLTRRVFRDGGSEYYINKTPCRLKDIQQLFMGTGVGRTSYSIMAQGNITQILSSKPEERRLVFEEAAGITRFKTQKKEALRKLESTEQNLLRVADLIREVKRQIISLQRQAGKARRYKQFMADLEHLETQLARHNYDLLQTDMGERQARLEQLRGEIEQASGEVLRGEEHVGALRGRLSAVEHQMAQANQRGLELKAEAEQHESRIHFNDERLRELTDRNSKALGEIAQAEERRLIAEQEKAALLERIEASAVHLGVLRGELEERRQKLQALENDLRDRQETVRAAQGEVFQAAQQLSRARNEINALDLQKQADQVRLEKLSAEKLQLETERTRLEERLAEFARESESEKQNLQVRRMGVEERQGRLREVQERLQDVSRQLDGLQREQAEGRSRLTVLEQLEASHEGYGAGALAALRETQHVLGTLADRIRVPADFVVPVETALGHHLQLVLTEHPEAAHQILADLATNKKGRASIASLALHQGNGEPAAGAVTPEVEQRLQELACVPVLGAVQSDDAVHGLLESLLGRTRLATDLVAATAAWRESGGMFDFVTRQGELLSRHGVFTGGYPNGTGKGPSSILGRKNQIAEMEGILAVLQEKVHGLSRSKGEAQSEQISLQAGLQQEQTELREREVALATRQGEFNILQNALRSLHHKIDTVVYEIQSLAAHQEEGETRRASLAGDAETWACNESRAQEQLAALTRAIEGLREQREQIQASVAESKIALAAEEQVSASHQHQRGPLEQRISELLQQAEQRRREIDTVVARQEKAQGEIEESRRRIDALRDERELVGCQVAGLAQDRDAQAADIGGREEALRGARRRLAEAQEQRGQLDVEVAQKQMAAQNLCERVLQKYQVRLEDVRSECITITFAAEGPARVVTLTPEEMATAGVATDWNVVAEQVTALQKRIDEMGPVNLVAIEEYEETEQRHQFLSTQHEDLTKAREQLLDVIQRVNAQTRAMFTETFEKIRENFRATFVEIFGGGHADLNLVDTGDVLESGIEIMARPPGKQLRSITLLSGGEQTMTAVALLFAIYQVRPSPFCLLDELDAPLDESNINRFIRILQRFLAHSQFIIITHNKRTIAMADVLYGITMQEQGVSKIVSVKFHKADGGDAPAPAAPLELPATVKSVDEEGDREQQRDETLEVSVTE